MAAMFLVMAAAAVVATMMPLTVNTGSIRHIVVCVCVVARDGVLVVITVVAAPVWAPVMVAGSVGLLVRLVVIRVAVTVDASVLITMSMVMFSIFVMVLVMIGCSGVSVIYTLSAEVDALPTKIDALPSQVHLYIARLVELFEQIGSLLQMYPLKVLHCGCHCWSRRPGRHDGRLSGWSHHRRGPGRHCNY